MPLKPSSLWAAIPAPVSKVDGQSMLYINKLAACHSSTFQKWNDAGMAKTVENYKELNLIYYYILFW